MSLSINYSRSKINVILPASSIAAIVLRLPAACRRFSPDQGDRRLAAKPLMISVILIITLCAPYTSRFPNPAASGDRSGSLSGVSAWCLLYRPVFSWSGATRLKDIVLIG